MTKYNVGDVLEITEDFTWLGADFKSGDKYKVAAVTSSGYNLEPLQAGHSWSAYPSEFDRLETIRKVEFKVGDKVRLLEGGHSSPGYSCDATEKVKARLAGRGLDYQTVFVVDQEVDLDGDVHVFHAESCVGLYVLPEFLVPWVEEEDKSAEHMELGKTYQSTSNRFFYTPTEFDFEAGLVMFDFVSDVGDFASTSHRYFYSIEEEFGVLPPVKPVEVSQVALDELKDENTLAEVEQEDVGGWDREEFASAAPEPETVSVDALREAWDYVDHEYPDIENLIKLAKRLS